MINILLNLQKNKSIRIISILLCCLTISFLSVKMPTVLLGATALVVYIALVYYFLDEAKIKACLPAYLVCVLFQDTIVINVELVSSQLGRLVSYIDEAFLLVLLGSVILRSIRGTPLKGKSIVIALIGLLLLGFVSSFIHDVPVNISVLGAFLFVKGLLYLFVFMNLNFTADDISKLIKLMKVVAIIVVVFAIVDLLMWKQFRMLLLKNTVHDIRAGMVSVQSLFIHPAIYGWFMVFVGTFAAAAFKVTGKRAYLMAAGAFYLFGMLSFKFKTMLAVFVIILILYMLSGFKKALVYLFPASLILVAAWFLGGSYVKELTLLTYERYINVDMYDSARNALYMVALTIGQTEFPFGVGFGRYGSFVAREHYSPVYYEYGMDKIWGLEPSMPVFATDTYWPIIIGETGFIGLVILVFLFAYLLVSIFRRFGTMEKTHEKILGLFAGLVFTHAIFESLGEPIFNSAPQNVFLFITIGIAMSFLTGSGSMPNAKPK